MSPYLLHVSTIVAAVFAATLPVYVQGEKPVAGKPGAQKPSAVKKAASPVGPIFLGTTQLPGDFGKLATTYTIGRSKPINFTLKSAEYSVDSLTIGTRTWVPKGDEKLLLLRYTIHNPCHESNLTTGLRSSSQWWTRRTSTTCSSRVSRVTAKASRRAYL